MSPVPLLQDAVLVELRPESLTFQTRDRAGYLFHSRLSLAALSESDRSLIALFIAKGRGSPGLAPGRAR